MKLNSNTLYRRRWEMGLSQKDLAEALSISPSYMSDLVRGRKRISADLIERLAEVLNVTTEELIDDVEGAA